MIVLAACACAVEPATGSSTVTNATGPSSSGALPSSSSSSGSGSTTTTAPESRTSTSEAGSGRSSSGALASGSTTSATSTGSLAQQFVVATANLRCLLDDWPTRRALLVEEFTSLDPDVFAVQEVCRTGVQDNLAELLSDLAEQTGRTYSVVAADTHVSWDIYDEGIAIVSAHGFASQMVVDLPAGVFGRKLVVGEVQLGEHTIVVGGTHLSFGAEQENVRQAQLSAAVKALQDVNPEALTLIAGDFNEDPSGEAIAAATAAGFVDLWTQGNPPAPGFTFPAARPTTRIDYLMMAERSSATLEDAAIFLSDPTAGVWPSDHRGVWVSLIPTL